MVARAQRKLINPRLGTYFAIFSSALVGLVFLLLISAEVGADSDLLKQVMIIGPIAIYVAIGLSSYASETEVYFVAGRAVPSFFNGLVGAITIIGGVGLAAIGGGLFLIGYDALGPGIGMLLGVMVLVSLLVPYLRKYGGQTVPGFLGRRFDSRRVRMLSAVLMSVPLVLLMVAELRLGGTIVANLFGQPLAFVLPIAGIIVFATLIGGGTKGQTWSGCAQGIVVLFAILTPLVALSVLMTNLPIPQLSYGSVLGDVAKLEAQSGLAARSADLFAIQLPTNNSQPIRLPLLAAFSSVGPIGFILVSLSVMVGVATLPSILTRAVTTPSVFEARKSIGWIAVIVGGILLSLPAYVVFARHAVLSDLVDDLSGQLVGWVAMLEQLGIATLNGDLNQNGLDAILFTRDGALLVLPIAANFPDTIVYLVAAGIVAASLAATSAHMLSVGNMLTDDVLFGLGTEPVPSLARAIFARGVLGLVAIIAIYLSLNLDFDPFRLMLSALSLAGSTGFVVLVLSIWWKRLNAFGSVSALLVGFIVCGGYMLLTEQRVVDPIAGIDPVVTATFVVPLTALVAIVVSIFTRPPERDARNFVRDLRVPGGETIFDREGRLARGRHRRKG